MPPLEIERAAAAGSFAQTVAQRMTHEDAGAEPPAYELEPEEALVYEAAEAALSPVATTIFGRPAEIHELEVPAPLEDVREAEATPQELVAAPPPAASERIVLLNAIDASGVRFLARVLQDGSALGLLGHFLVANGLMARHPLQSSGDALGLAKFAAEQAAQLNRLMLQARMKRPVSLEAFASPPPVEAIARIARLAPAPEAEIPPAPRGGISLFVALEAPSVAFLGRTAAAEKTPPFVRNRQVTAALLPRGARTGASSLPAVDALLAAYAEASMAAITRYFVQLRLSPSLLPNAVRDAALERAAQALIEGLGRALSGESGAQ